MTRPGRQISRKQYEALTGEKLGYCAWGILWTMQADIRWQSLDLPEELETEYRQALLAASDVIGLSAMVGTFSESFGPGCSDPEAGQARS
jgi:hypothetical protein